MSDYVNKLKLERKIELSQKVSLSVAEEIWNQSWMIETAEEFVDYLMTVTDEEAIEEFFARCEEEGGRFCGNSGADVQSFASWMENKHKRGGDGKFVKKAGGSDQRGVKGQTPQTTTEKLKDQAMADEDEHQKALKELIRMRSYYDKGARELKAEGERLEKLYFKTGATISSDPKDMLKTSKDPAESKSLLKAMEATHKESLRWGSESSKVIGGLQNKYYIARDKAEASKAKVRSKTPRAI